MPAVLAGRAAPSALDEVATTEDGWALEEGLFGGLVAVLTGLLLLLVRRRQQDERA